MKHLSYFSQWFHSIRISTILVLTVVIFLTGSFAFYSISDMKDKEDAIKVLLGIKSYTIELAEAMPADQYTYKPHDSVRSFGEQIAHIGMSTSFLLDVFINDQPMPTDPAMFAEVEKMEKKLGQSKEECIKLLNESFDKLIMAYKNADDALMNSEFTVPFDPRQPSFTKSTGFEFLNDHIIHHRSQALVSLRMQGISAPQFRLYSLE